MRNLRPRFSLLAPRAAALSLLVMFATARAEAQLSATEQSLTRAVDATQVHGLALLERLVNINSGTMNFAGVHRVGEVLRAQLDSLGFQTRWTDGTATGRAGELIAEHPGRGPKILLIGHLDTVFEPTSPFQRFERIDSVTARGPGIVDMKGGDVILVEALRALKASGQLAGLHLVVVLNGDEESPGRPIALSRQPLREAAAGAAYAVSLDFAGGDPATAVVARRSSIGWTLRTTGQTGHSGQIFGAKLGAGAIYEASRIVSAFYERLTKEQGLTFSAGLFLGGSATTIDSAGTAGSASGKRNVVPDQAVVTGDLRALTPEQEERAKSVMNEIVTHHLPKTTATLQWIEGYPSMASTAANNELLARFSRVATDLGSAPLSALDPTKGGAADVAFVAGIVPAILDGASLSGHDSHSDGETADLRTFTMMTKRVAVLLHRLGTVTP
jgi:glutamate carboxypeptidase